jgi:hypothetical protein
MVPEREELMGRMSLESRLPQYLTTAMLTGAVQVTLTESAGRVVSRPVVLIVICIYRKEEERVMKQGFEHQIERDW